MKFFFTLFISIALILPVQQVHADIGDTNTDNINEIINCDKNQTTSTPPSIPSFTWNGSGIITLWFDDAWITQYSTAFPLMEKYGYKGALAVAVKLVCYSAFMNWDQVRTLQNHGWETTAHSVMHNCDLGYYTTKTTQYELAGSKQMIESHGIRADQFVMPCGYSRQQINAQFEYNHPPIIETAKQYFMSYRTTQSARLNPIPIIDRYSLDAFQLQNTTTDQEIQANIDKAKKQHAWLIIVIHQIDDTNRPFSITQTKFVSILNMIKASKLPVALPSQVLAIKK